MENKFNIDEVREFWDKVAPIYEPANKKVGYIHYQRFEKTIELGNIQPDQKILNIWSRTGSLIPYLRKTENLTILNREVSPEFIKIAKSKFSNEDFQQTDLEDLSEFEDNSFDRIISLETLEHTPKPLTFLKELKRTLKPDGLLIMSLPPKGFEIITRIYDALGNNHGEGPHLFLNPNIVKDLALRAGLKIIKHKPFIMLPIFARQSEKILTFLFGKTFLANFGVRHFYIFTK